MLPIIVHHGNIEALGFRVAGLAYTPDLNGIPERSLTPLSALDVWIVDALRKDPHPSHFHLSETLAWVARMKPKRAILTNMHVDLDYGVLSRMLPKPVEPAYDGMMIAI